MTNDLDWTHINNLLSVIHSAASAGPKYNYIVSRAESELTAHMQANPLPPEVPAEEPTTAPPAALTAVDPPSGNGEPGPDATAPTAVDRRV